MNLYDSLRNKVVLITGASSGIGARTAVEFAKHGCRVAISGRNMDNLHKTAQQCQNAGLDRNKMLLMCADIAEDTDVEKLVHSVVQTFGHIDVLVNSAGILGDSSVTKGTMADYDHVMRVNSRGPLYLIRTAVPHLLKSKGNIVNVSSFSGLRPTQGVLFYAMSKAALDQMTRILAAELAPKGVRVNSVNPGLIRTGMHLRSGFTEEKYAKMLEGAGEVHPIGRPGEAEDVANAIVFFASEAASFVTGVTMQIDGGRMCVVPRGGAAPQGTSAKL